MKDKIKNLFNIMYYRVKINNLENNNKTLENIIKNELYDAFMRNINENMEIDRLRKENKKLRDKNKVLKDIIKEKDQ